MTFLKPTKTTNMDEIEFNQLSKELQDLSQRIPLNWGMIQNDITDKQINIFKINDIVTLEDKIKELSEKDRNYFRRRWFLWQCARVDEYLFYRLPSVIANPSSKDQAWDIEFKGDSNLRFDLKGTVVPKILQADFTLADEKKIIDFYYKNQSKGVRDNYQNRIFVVHHSFKELDRSMNLRCQWELKTNAFQAFSEQISEKKTYKNRKRVQAKCLFILENELGEHTFQF